MKDVIFTIVTKSYYARALALGDSVLKFNKNVEFWILFADRKDTNFQFKNSKFNHVWVEDINIPNVYELAFKYGITEFATAIKPFFFKFLFNQSYHKVLYLDPDTILFDALCEPFYLLDNNFIVLTPHVTDIAPINKRMVPEKAFLFSGVYNLGFIALLNNENGNKFLDWWSFNLSKNCFHDYTQGLFTDQKWLDFIHCYFDEGVAILKHKGYNISNWNFHEREISINSEGKYVVNNTYPLKLLHFSGIDISKGVHPYTTLSDYSYGNIYKKLIDEYIQLVRNFGNEEYAKIEYGFNKFENGIPIYRIHRRLFRIILEKEKFTEDPFKVSSSFYLRLKKSKLLIRGNIKTNDIISKKDFINPEKQLKKLFILLKIFKFLFGLNKYLYVLKVCSFLNRDENQIWLLKKDGHIK